MAFIGAIFTSTYHTKQLNPWPNSSASHVVNYSRLSACQRNIQLFEGDPSTCARLTSLRTSHVHSKSNQDNFQHQYLPELLVNVYVYHLMVKSVSCCCVCGSWLFSNLVTYDVSVMIFVIDFNCGSKLLISFDCGLHCNGKSFIIHFEAYLWCYYTKR